jgi:hypothetical protein
LVEFTGIGIYFTHQVHKKTVLCVDKMLKGGLNIG